MTQSHLRLAAAVSQPIDRFSIPLDENAFVDWLVDADPGNAIVYYRGHLAHDRMSSARVLAPRARSELQTVAKRVMTASAQGLVIPVQKRIGPEDFLYLAIKAVGGLKRRPRSIGAAALGGIAPAITLAPLIALAA